MLSENENEENVETTEVAGGATESTSSIDVFAEIKNAITIIDYASEQGAFKGWGVINQVLAVRGRLLAFADMMEQAIKQANPEAFQDAAEEDKADDSETAVDADTLEAAIDAKAAASEVDRVNQAMAEAKASADTAQVNASLAAVNAAASAASANEAKADLQAKVAELEAIIEEIRNQK